MKNLKQWQIENDEKFDEKFGHFYLYSHSGNFFHATQEKGEKKFDIDIEINAKQPTASDDIKSFLHSSQESLKKVMVEEMRRKWNKLSDLRDGTNEGNCKFIDAFDDYLLTLLK